MSGTQQETLHFLDYWRVIRSRKEVVISVSLLVIITGVLFTYAMQRTFMASTIIQVTEDTPAFPVFQTEMTRFDPLFLRTQFEIIQSTPIVEAVVEKLELTEKLGRAYGYLEALGDRAEDETVRLISRSMKVQQYRDTNLIEVQIYLSELGGDPEGAPALAAQIADAIADTFREQSVSRTQKPKEKALAALWEASERQNQRVLEAEKEVAAIRDKYKINVIGSSRGSIASANSLDKIRMQHLEVSRIQLRLELEDKKARLDMVDNLSPKKLLDSAAYLSKDPTLPSLVADKRTAQIELNRLLKGDLGPKHPDVVQVEAVIGGIDARINDALEGLKTGMETDYGAAQAKFNAVENELEELKADERVDEGSAYREFNAAIEKLEEAKDIRNALEIRHIQEDIERNIPTATVEVIQPAKAPEVTDPVRPNKPLNIVLSIMLGLISGVGLAYFIEYLDTSVKTIEDIEQWMGVSVLGVIPQKVKPLIEERAEHAHAEAYRVLKTNLQLSKKINKGQCFCVTSGSVGEGKSLTLFNLAYVCAQLGDRVLIVDSDLHRPRQHKIMGVSNVKGLATILMDQATIEECIVSAVAERLDFMPSGRLPSGAHGLLATEKMAALVKDLKSRYDLVFFDSPPIVGVSDASMLVRQVDGVMLVIQHRKYPRALSSRAKEMIINVGGNLLGVVLNNINISRDHTYYYYQQHYYYYPRGGRGDRKRRAKEKKGDSGDTTD